MGWGTGGGGGGVTRKRKGKNLIGKMKNFWLLSKIIHQKSLNSFSAYISCSPKIFLTDKFFFYEKMVKHTQYSGWNELLDDTIFWLFGLLWHRCYQRYPKFIKIWVFHETKNIIVLISFAQKTNHGKSNIEGWGRYGVFLAFSLRWKQKGGSIGLGNFYKIMNKVKNYLKAGDMMFFF